MSTQVVSGAVTSGGTEIPESSSKLRHGHLRHNSIRHDSIHTLHHHPGTESKFHWPLFLISAHIGRRGATQLALYKLDKLLGLPSTIVLSSEAFKGRVHHESADEMSGCV